MPVLELTITATLDSTPLTGFPLLRRLTIDESQPFDYEQATGGGYLAVPGDKIDTVQALVVRTDKALTLRLDGQTDAGIEINAGGCVVLVDVTIDAGAGASNAKLSNASGATARIRGVTAGT